MFWFVPCAFFSTNNFAHVQALYRMGSLCRSYECMNIVRVNIGFFAGFKKIKQRRISFVLVYLRTILWKNPTAISIKHRILATFNIKKILNSFYLPLNMTNKYERWMGVQEMQLYIYIEIIYQNKLKKTTTKKPKRISHLLFKIRHRKFFQDLQYSYKCLLPQLSILQL